MRISWNLQKRINEAKTIAFLTGAGISVASGIPAFRGSGEGGVASPMTIDHFSRDPAACWQYFESRRKLVSESSPSKAHLKIAKFEELKGFCPVITQNIDGLHQRAGSKRVIELHGNLSMAKCHYCGLRTEAPIGEFSSGSHSCPSCSSILAPDIVFFGMNVDEELFERAEELISTSDLLLVIGTSGMVAPANILAPLAMERGVHVVNINRTHSMATRYCHEQILGDADDVLEALWEAHY